MTSSDECVSSNYDEGRSEVRYAVRLADFREPLDFRTHPAPPDLRWQIRVSVFFQTSTSRVRALGFRPRSI